MWGQTGGHPTGPSTSQSIAGHVDGPAERFRPATGPRTKSETAVWKFLVEHRKIIISLRDLSEEVRVPEATVRKVLHRLEAHGFLVKSKAAGNDGMVLAFTPDGQTSGQPNGQTTGLSASPSKIDREKNLSISLEAIRLTWPRLAATGFGPDQLAQIESNLIVTGQATDRVLPSLHHAEWELEHGKMLDKDGRPVADPCSWVFRSLVRTGYYRKPPGYVSMEEQAAKDKEETARAVSFWRQKADAARFEAWRDGLSPSEMEHMFEGFPDLREGWLKAYWKKFIY
uniref:Putative transcriptional regulator n=1 Tax=Desulfovibrio sp. U5L TaxID=596152 RepID=I2PZD0_9BACT